MSTSKKTVNDAKVPDRKDGVIRKPRPVRKKPRSRKKPREVGKVFPGSF